MSYGYNKEYLENLRRQRIEMEKRKLEAFDDCEILGERPISISYTGNMVMFKVDSVKKIQEKIRDLEVNGIIKPEWFDLD